MMLMGRARMDRNGVMGMLLIILVSYHSPESESIGKFLTIENSPALSGPLDS
jgi:hypothetical protein